VTRPPVVGDTRRGPTQAALTHLLPPRGLAAIAATVTIVVCHHTRPSALDCQSLLTRLDSAGARSPDLAPGRDRRSPLEQTGDQRSAAGAWSGDHAPAAGSFCPMPAHSVNLPLSGDVRSCPCFWPLRAPRGPRIDETLVRNQRPRRERYNGLWPYGDTQLEKCRSFGSRSSGQDVPLAAWTWRHGPTVR